MLLCPCFCFWIIVVIELNKYISDRQPNIQSLKTSDNKVFEFKKEIATGNFFYLDKFIIIGTENSFLLCKYFIDSNKNDIQRQVFSI